MAREPELSIRVSVDPTIDRDVFQQKIDALIPESKPIKINGEIDAAKALKSIGDYQAGNKHLVPILATISNAQAAIDAAFKDKDTPVNITIGAQGLSTIKTQLQGIIDSLDYSKIKLPNKNPNGNNSNLSIDVTLNVTQQALDDLKANVEKNIKAIDVPLDITQTTLDNIKTKIENALNQIQFNPNPQVKNPPPGGGGGGGNSQTSKERALVRNLIEQAQIGNKRDTANKNKRYRNAGVQNGRINDLQMTESSLRSDISKTNPNYQNEEWYQQAEQKAKYIQDNQSSLQADKDDLDIVKKLNAELDKNVKLRRELSKISKINNPQEHANKNQEIKKSDYQVAKLGAQAHKQGVYLGNIRKDHVNQVKEIEEDIKNNLFKEYEDELKKYIQSGYRYNDAKGSNNYEKSTRLWNEQNKHKNNLDSITKEMRSRAYDTYNPKDSSETYQKFVQLTQHRTAAENELALAIKEKTDAQKEASAIDNKDVSSIAKITAQLERQKHTLEGSDEGRASSVYSIVSSNASISKSLTDDLNNNQGVNKDLIARSWANKNGITGIQSLADAYEYLKKEVSLASIEVEKFSDENTKLNKQLQNEVRIQNLQSQLHDYLEKYPRVESKMSEQVSKLQNELFAPDAADNVKELSLQMAELRAQAKKAGYETENLLDKFEKLFGQHLSTMVVMAALHKMQDAARQVYQNVVDIDTAMTELRKVTNETDATYTKFMENAANRAQRVGATISDTITATADFARLGYNLDDASSISDAALIYKNVGDGITDINDASESLISTMQAFNVQAKDSMKIVDEFNEAGNNFAISSSGVGEALQKSGAALAAANNTMEQSIALATTMNRVVQNPETVGTTLKTVAMYLRSTKAEVEAAGESTEGMAETTSKLRDSLKALSHGQVDIFDNATKQYKSTTDIIIEMGKAWDVMSDKEQAAALELMGGKRNANALSALIQNYEEIEKVIETVSNASGSAETENQKYLSSINGMLTELDSTFQSFSTHVLNSDVPKFFISIATAIVKAADAMVKFTGAFPMGAGILSFIGQLGEPKMTGFMIVPSNTPGGDTEQVLRRYSIVSMQSMREYLEKPTNMTA